MYKPVRDFWVLFGIRYCFDKYAGRDIFGVKQIFVNSLRVKKGIAAIGVLGGRRLRTPGLRAVASDEYFLLRGGFAPSPTPEE